MLTKRCNILKINRRPLLFCLCHFSIWKSEIGNNKQVWRNVNSYIEWSRKVGG